jgi:Zn-dependent protease with chaperone function
LRTFFGAKPFDSSELDSLAERMGVMPSLGRNPRDRYFTTGARDVTAATLGSKVVFGKSYFERLSDDERLAVCAHEFSHIMDHDNERSKIASSSLGVSLILVTAAFLGSHSVLLAESVFCVSFLGLAGILSSRDAERSRLQELRCDNVAASFVGGGPMIASIRLADSMLIQKSRRSLLRRSRRNQSPTVDERASAIMALRPLS